MIIGKVIFLAFIRPYHINELMVFVILFAKITDFTHILKLSDIDWSRALHLSVNKRVPP